MNGTDFFIFWHGLSMLTAAVAFFMYARSGKGGARRFYLSFFLFLCGLNEWTLMFIQHVPAGDALRIAGYLFSLPASVFLCEYLAGEHPGWRMFRFAYIPWFAIPLLMRQAGVDPLLAGRYVVVLPLFILLTLSIRRWDRVRNGNSIIRYSMFMWYVYILLWIVPSPGLILPAVLKSVPFINAIAITAAASGAVLLCGAIFMVIMSRYNLFFTLPSVSEKWIIPSAYAAIIVIMFPLVTGAGSLTEKDMRNNVLCIARNISAGINPERIRQLGFTASDRENPVFQRIRRQMKTWGDYTGLRSIYSMQMRNGILIFGPENLDENDPFASPPGTEYRMPDRAFIEAWVRGESGTTGPYTDEYGSFVTGYAPVFDSVTGQVLMLVCVDFDAVSWETDIRRGRLRGFVPVMVLSLFLVYCLVVFNMRKDMPHAERGFFYNYLGAISLFIGGLIIVCTTSWWMDYLEDRGLDREFRAFADSWSNIIRSVVYETRKQSDDLALYFRNSEYVSPDEFSGYYSGRNIKPTVYISWYPAVKRPVKGRFEQRMRAEGFPGYRIFSVKPDGEHDFSPAGDVLFPLVYTSQMEPGEVIPGMDISVMPGVREAGAAGLTGIIPERGDGTLSDEMMLINPVYRAGELLGLIVSGVDMKLTLARVLAYRNSISEGITVVLADIGPGGEERVMSSFPYDMDREAVEKMRGRYPVYPLFYAGRTLAVIVGPSESFLSTHMVAAGVLSFAGGMLITITLSLISAYFIFREQTLEQTIENRTAELSQSEKRFRTLHDASFGGIAIHDKGLILSCNRALSLMSGYTTDELTGMDGLLLIAPSFRDMVRGKIAAAYEKTYSAEMITKDGRIFPVDITGKEIPLEGKTVRVTEFRDITDRRNTELLLESQRMELEANYEEMRAQMEEFEAMNEELIAANSMLADSEEKFSRAFRINPAMMIISTLDRGEFVDVNETFLLTTGYSREEIIGKTSLELGFFVDYSRRDIAVDLVISSGTVRNYEVELRTKDGSVRHGLFSADKIRIGDRDYMLSVMNDITDRKRFEAALRESEKKYRMLFESSLDAIFIVEDYRFIDCNKTAADMFRCGREDLIGSTPAMLSPELQPGGERSDTLSLSRLDAAYGGRPQTFPWIHMTKDGVEFETEVLLGSFELGERKIIFTIVRDVTERKRYELRLNHMQKMDAIGQLAGGIAHDFNNQLSGIMGYAELLTMKLQDPALKKYSEGIMAVAARSSEITKRLLVFSRKRDFSHVPCDLHMIIRDTTEILEHSIDKRINVVHNLDAADFTVSGDPAELQNMLLNLGLNARDAMENGGTLTYSTSVTGIGDEYSVSHFMTVSPGYYILVTIADTGCGMSDEVKAHLFEPFFTTKGEGRGTGMGLASVYATVKNHGGSISVYSETGRGTVFKIYLPVSHVIHEETGDTEQHIIPLPPLNILIVDDEKVIREILAEMLVSEGHNVIDAEDGGKAVAIYSEHRDSIDIVILDMVMPGMNGRDTLEALRKINPSLRVILSSGFNLETESEKLKDSGVRGYVHKPFQKSELFRVLSNSLK